MSRIPLPVQNSVLELGSRKYSLESVCGAGGTGIVYSAREQGTGRFVAIKEVYPYADARRELWNVVPAWGCDDDNLSRLKQRVKKREVEISQKADEYTAFVVPLEAVYEEATLIHEGIRYPVQNMFCVSGNITHKSVPLRKYMEELSNPTLYDIAKIMEAVAKAYASLHTKTDILHADCSFGNLFVMHADAGKRTFEHIKILDFGNSHLLENGTVRVPKDERWITTGFAAPEWYELDREDKVTLSRATDVYSIGMLFWRLLRKRQT